VKFLSQASCLALLGAGLAAVPVTQAVAAGTASAPVPGESLVQQMTAEAQGPVALTPEPATGKVGFVRVAPRGDLSPSDPARTALGAADKAGDYLAEYAPAFGATPDQLRQTGVRTNRYGTTVTFEQVHRGVPVFGSMLLAHLDQQGDLTSVNGYAAPGVDISVTPGLSAGQAATRAVSAVRADPPSHNGRDADTTGIRAATIDLVVYRTGATRGVVGDNVLTFVVEVTNGDSVRDMVFVDANTGKLLNRYSVMHGALERHVFEGQFSPAAEVWTEGDDFPGLLNEDQQNIVLGSGESYWFFQNAFGRDSYDGRGHRMDSVNNDPTIACPNANWNGTTTNYCNGVTSDDVVAHEWAHAYTEFTHGLIYQWQPGALNESYSDIWGETVDLINGRQDEGSFQAKRQDGVCSSRTALPTLVTINSPAPIAKTCDSAPAQFGPALTEQGITQDVVLADDGRAGDGSTSNACSALRNGADIAGNIALVDRGTCAFTEKVANAQAAGAVAVLVGNNVAGAPFPMAGADPAITIPSTMIGQSDRNLVAGELTNGPVNVTMALDAGDREDSFRWLMGEGATAFGGAIRDMWTPTCLGDPGKVSDAEYHCTPDDGGGVHSNSGVPNHAFALTVDGGTFNGQTVTGIGLTKAAAVYFRAMTVYQTPTTDFADHADALEAACADLVRQPLNELSTREDDSTPSGEVISARDCATFDAAAAAVELRREPTQCNFQPMFDPNPPALCGPRADTRTVFSESFDDGLAGWGRAGEVVVTGASGEPWVADSTLPKGRAGTAAYGGAPDRGQCDGSAADFSSRDSIISPVVNIPSGDAVARKLSFDHYVATELGFDGGNVKYRTGRRWQVIPAGAYTFNAPDQIETTANGNTNPMAGQPGFTGTDGGEVTGSWGTSHVDLSALRIRAGQDVRFRFDIGRDGCGGIDGWYVDDVTVTVCQPAAGGRVGGTAAGRRN
jgi:Zn-dependent metalloprotease